MKAKNPFDTKLALRRKMPRSMREALEDSVDTLEMCWAGVQAVFESKARPEHALELLAIVMAEARRTKGGAPSSDT